MRGRPSLPKRGVMAPAALRFCAVSQEGTAQDHGGGMLAGLLAPLRLPERAIEALDSLAEAARELAPMRSELIRVREQTAPLADLMPTAERIREQTAPVPELLAVAARIREQAEPLPELVAQLERVEGSLGARLDSIHKVVEALESEESYLNKAVKELARELAAMHDTVSGLQLDVEGITERLPDPNAGPLAKAREALTGSGD